MLRKIRGRRNVDERYRLERYRFEYQDGYDLYASGRPEEENLNARKGSRGLC